MYSLYTKMFFDVVDSMQCTYNATKLMHRTATDSGSDHLLTSCRQRRVVDRMEWFTTPRGTYHLTLTFRPSTNTAPIALIAQDIPPLSTKTENVCHRVISTCSASPVESGYFNLLSKASRQIHGQTRKAISHYSLFCSNSACHSFTKTEYPCIIQRDKQQVFDNGCEPAFHSFRVLLSALYYYI